MYLFLFLVSVLIFLRYFAPTRTENFTDDYQTFAYKVLHFLNSGPSSFATYSNFINSNGNKFVGLGKISTYKTLVSNPNLSVNDILTFMV